jgi:hypothetical protein
MEQQVEVTLKLNLWLDAEKFGCAETIGDYVREHIYRGFDIQAELIQEGKLLDILTIKEEAELYAPNALDVGKRKYRVGFHYAQYGGIDVRADSPAKAEEKLEAFLDEEGLENLKYDSTDREFFAQDATLIKEKK